MTTEDILDGFQDEGMGNDPEWTRAYGKLCQEAVKDCMELNNQYHTPEEIREIMSRLTGKTINGTFRLYPPFYADFGKNIRIAMGAWRICASDCNGLRSR